MAYKDISAYKSIQYRSFPREGGESHQKKDKDWAVQCLSSMLYRYTTGNMSELRYNWEYLKTLDKYAKGEQGSRKVKEKLLRYDKATGKFKGRMKDVFQTFDILPEMIDVIISNNMRSDYKPQAIAIDESSIKDRDLEINLAKFLVEEQTKEFLKFMGIKVDSALTDDEINTFTSSQVDVLFKSGGIQLERERACLSVCNTAMLFSGHKEIENMCTLDSLTYGICATKNYWDYNEGVAKYRHVDIKNLVIPSSKYNDFRDITYAGEIVMMTLGEISSQCPNLTKEQVKELVLCNSSYNSDFTATSDIMESYLDGKNDIFSEYRIAVFDAQWLATDEEKYLQSYTSRGRDIFKKTDKDFRVRSDRGQKIDRKQFVKKYEAKWVIGTDLLIHFDKSSNVVYAGPRGNRIPKLDYNIVKTGKKSLVDRCRTIVDDINLAVAKLRSAIATLPPAPRMIVRDSALQNVKMGGILQSPRDLFGGFAEDGVFVVNDRDHKGNYIQAKPVEFVPTGLAEDITIFSNEAAQKVNMLRQVIGLPEGLDGTAGQKYQLASTMNLAAASSANALYPHLSLISPLFEKTFDNSVTMTQAMCRSTEVKVKEINLSERVINVFKLSKNFSNYDFKVSVQLSPTDSEREMLLNQINEMSQMFTQSQGTLGCSKAEYLMLYRLIKAGLIQEAMYQIAVIEDLRNKASIQRDQANIQANAEQQQQSARVAEDEKRKTALLKGSEDRKTAEMTELMEGVMSMMKQVLDQKEGQAPVNRTLASNMIQENQAKIDAIKQSDMQSMNPQMEAPMQENQIMV